MGPLGLAADRAVPPLPVGALPCVIDGPTAGGTLVSRRRRARPGTRSPIQACARGRIARTGSRAMPMRWKWRAKACR